MGNRTPTPTPEPRGKRISKPSTKKLELEQVAESKKKAIKYATVQRKKASVKAAGPSKLYSGGPGDNNSIILSASEGDDDEWVPSPDANKGKNRATGTRQHVVSDDEMDGEPQNEDTGGNDTEIDEVEIVAVKETPIEEMSKWLFISMTMAYPLIQGVWPETGHHPSMAFSKLSPRSARRMACATTGSYAP